VDSDGIKVPAPNPDMSQSKADQEKFKASLGL